ncbi:MAG: glycosyltransferase [Clostridiales bacterium]|nr:glycosyltransferase [Clostridiales bacterium]
MGIEISLCMIVKNEQDTLAACLNSIQGLADEINIVDTGSTDSTLETAARYTDRLFHFDWIEDFAAARNFSFSKATKEYILWLDADDVLTAENRRKFLFLKENIDPKYDFFLMEYYASFDKKGYPSLIFPKTRLVRRDAGHVWKGAIHEALVGDGLGASIDIYVTHTHKELKSSNERNFAILKRQIESGNADMKDHFYYGLMLNFMDQPDEALPYLNRFMTSPYRREFDGIEAYIAAHHIYRVKQDRENALKVLKDNEAYMKDKSEYYCSLGFFYKEEMDDYERACACFKKALHCQGTFLRQRLPGQRNAEYYYFVPYYALGQCQVKLRRFDSALRYFRKALEYRPNEQAETLVKKLERFTTLRKQSESEEIYGH